MADAEKKKKSKSARGKARRGRVPMKTEINLAIVGEKHINGLIALPAVLLIILAAALFSKFLVIDRMMEVSAAEAEVARLQAQLDAGYAELTNYGELADLYAHYTFSGMTQEELQRVDRGDVLDLLDRVVLPQAGVDSLTLSGNQMTLNMKSSTLQEINLLVQQLELEPMVDFCSVTTAVSNETDGNRVKNAMEQVVVGDDVVVTARVMVYLNPVQKEGTA